MNRAAVVLLVCVWAASCGGGVDQKKFDAVYQAGKALQAEVESGGRDPGPKSRDRLKDFDNAIAALQGHTIGIHEVDTLKAYSKSADAYRYFLRFRTLDLDADAEAILLKGPNIEVAGRFKLPVDQRSSGKWVNRGQATTILLQAGEQHLADGNRMIGVK